MEERSRQRQENGGSGTQGARAVLAGELVLDTPVLTLQGPVKVQDLRLGDRVVTRNGARQIMAIAARTVALASVVRLGESTLGVDLPSQDLLLSPEQPVLVRDWRARALAGAGQALVPAGRLADDAFIRPESAVSLQVFRLTFDAPTVFFAANLELAG
ncbi:hypothetical protein GCM10007315_05240 [Gemmobacter tilapiae]|uniref:Hedgehog/Intein (Hint) domain-containing protein n=2 Tax=Neogemmobacter tilapiae TaxID=875041 RepID=A0A918TG36_9RHOB|nr:hypothetical protein GCM10007315_05240 [Gemmobacter tilapiae]